MDKDKEMTLLTSLGISLIAIACAGAFYFFVLAKGNPVLSKSRVTINNAVFDVEVASSTFQKIRGLSFRTSLGDSQGMLFTFGTGRIQTFWMKDMNFPLDMIWISGNTVVGFTENAVPQPGAAPWKLTIYSSPDGTDKVLEVNAGTVAKDNIKVGDPVQISI